MIEYLNKVDAAQKKAGKVFLPQDIVQHNELQKEYAKLMDIVYSHSEVTPTLQACVL